MFATTVLASAIVSVVATGPVESWLLLRPKGEGYSVRMPGPVEEAAEDLVTDLATLRRVTYTCSSNQALWQLCTVDLPQSVLAQKRQEEILSTAVHSSQRGPKDQIFSEGSGKRDGAPYVRFRVVPRVGPVVSNLVLLDGGRLYHLQVVSRPDRFRRVGTKEFFDSFRLDR